MSFNMEPVLDIENQARQMSQDHAKQIERNALLHVAIEDQAREIVRLRRLLFDIRETCKDSAYLTTTRGSRNVQDLAADITNLINSGLQHFHG